MEHLHERAKIALDLDPKFLDLKQIKSEETFLLLSLNRISLIPFNAPDLDPKFLDPTAFAAPGLGNPRSFFLLSLRSEFVYDSMVQFSLFEFQICV
jgi:hypothetical protein